MLHVPSVEKLLERASKNCRALEVGHQALLFAIYYAAIASLEDGEVERRLGASKDCLVVQYRFAIEQALAKAHFLTTSDFVVLQAFVLFLVIVRRYDDTRFCWSMSCLAVRLGQGNGPPP